MFNHLGPPWPKHDCFNKQYQALQARVLPILQKGADPRSAKHQPFAQLSEMFGLTEPQDPTEEARTGTAKAKRPKPRQPQTPEHVIKRMDPMPAERISLVGIIRERGVKTAKIKLLYETLGALGRKLFNLPAPARAVQLTIVDVEGEPNESYSCVADAAMLDPSLVKDVMVWVTLMGKVSPSASAWVVKEIHAV